MADEENSEPRIAEATGSAGTNQRGGPPGALIEAAMGQAYEDAIAEGVTNPNVLRERKLAAREEVKQAWREGRI